MKRPSKKIAVKATPSAKPTIQATRLAHALQSLAKDLPNPWDESTDFFHGFAASMPKATKLDAEGFRAALGVGARYEIDISPADPVLKQLAAATADWGVDTAGGFAQLRTVMRATLTELSLVFARGKGVVRVRVWLCGRTADGTIVGLRSLSTET